ncbi:conserved hypothetical protein (plasmid) [Trichormus variabilis ATCC 29413]|uniref:Uncharacterized protein n=2 Tax=Anabaena variabilis TaxID=264691 RepID=Q3M1J0_TRIV2|nr:MULTISPECIES: hypothetical protein [Nostocaceae]ABA25153.1 conserved hypothetical protein [Trichormus variabilis ATCC 29413]MBC1218286.1 hypothetical protein [Trichormus variabilis ARAD]MBC1259570.1 hypothetical protein [Trichormus variabilis V5]MBC1271007.1 hypothetical protein [Trichormus variabilis FSR]MBC1306038.1 hypothetical protein [Trichormus variabilis N2B]
MSNQTSSDENATGFENSYSSKDFNPDIQDSLNLEKTLDESVNTEVTSQDSSSGITLSKTAIITIQLTPNSEKAIVTIGIQDAPPIIKIINLTEITSQPFINNWLNDLEKSLPGMLNICKQRMEKQTKEQNQQEQSRQVQKRNLPEDKDKKPAPNNQLSLF